MKKPLEMKYYIQRDRSLFRPRLFLECVGNYPSHLKVAVVCIDLPKKVPTAHLDKYKRRGRKQVRELLDRRELGDE